MEQAIIDTIKEVGFPIFVGCYLLIKGSMDTQKMTEALNELRIAIEKLNVSRDDDDGK
jgi:hypothetical protein